MQIRTVVFGGMFLFALSAYAQYYPARAPGSNDRRDEQDFVTLAAERVTGQIAHANLALQHGVDEPTRQVAQRIVIQDSQVLSDLKRIAAEQHFTLPGQLSAQGQEEQNVLSRLKGDRFDADYTEMSWVRLTFDVPRFEAEEKEASIPALSAFAAKYVPMMRGQTARLSEVAPRERGKAE